MAYRYIKAPPGFMLKRPPTGRQILRLVISAVMLTTGTTALTSVAYPMVVYELNYAPTFVKDKTPNLQGSVLSQTTTKVSPTFVKEMINTTFDYTNADTWFPEATHTSSNKDAIAYELSIPRLGIKDASVRNDHTDLKKTLIQYPGTAMPGDLGNTVIFGHSVLPQFFNPKNYLTIFSTLHTLSPGDQVIIKEGEVTYTYRITALYSVDPSDLSPLAQSYDRHSLTIITCTPPGTYLKRLIVRAELI